MKSDHPFEQADRRFWPRYSAKEAGRFLGMPAATLRRWFCEGGAGGPLFPDRARAPGEELALSFMELVEAHIARRYRELGVSAARLREVRPFLQEQIDSEYPLAARNFQFSGAYRLHDLSLAQPEACKADAMTVFEQHENSKSGSWRHLPGIIDAFYQLNYDPVAPRSLAYQFYPFGRDVPIVIFPPCGSGRLTVEGHNLLAEILAGQYRGGESIDDLADDYQLSEDTVRQVVQSLTTT